MSVLPGGRILATVSGSAKVPRAPAILVGVIAEVILLFNVINPKAFRLFIPDALREYRVRPEGKLTIYYRAAGSEKSILLIFKIVELERSG